MSKKVKKTIPWFLVAGILVVSLVIGLNSLKTDAAAPVSQVGINNEAPAFDVAPVESPSSHNGAGEGGTAGNPTNEGSDVTFEATGDDPNGDDYYLLLCDADDATASGGEGDAPACTGGTEYCVSSATTDETQASCTYTTLDGDTESEIWFAFVCDADACIASGNQGTGETGTPFYVNHDPTFDAYATGAGNPGATAAVTTNASVTDSDTDAVADTVSLYVCDAVGFTAGGSPSCTGTLLCSDIAAVSNPTCNISIAAVKPDGEWTAYGYVIDNHGLASSGIKYNTDEPYTVNNVAPVVTAGNIGNISDGAGDLNLTVSGADTTGFTVQFIVTDANSCVLKGGTEGTDNEIDSAIINVYKSDVGSVTCDETGEYDTDDCYPEANAGWTPVCVQDGGTCTDDTDNSVTWTCTFPLGFHANATVAGTPDAANDWEAAVQATDDGQFGGGGGLDTGLVPQDGAQGTEMATFMSYSLSAGDPISYGSLNSGADSAEQTTTLQAKGNVGIDEELSGTVMETDPNNGDDILAAQQKYDLTTSQTWDNMDGDGVDDDGILTGTLYETELDCDKPTHASASPTANTYWMLRVPTNQTAGEYAGVNTITGVTGELWTP